MLANQLRRTFAASVGTPPALMTTLGNGLRVVTQRVAGNDRTASINVVTATGTRYEDESNNGASHYLEHMFFKGTATRPRTTLEQEVENMGGHLNAFTSREYCCYSIDVFQKDAAKGLNILGDILQNSVLDPKLIEYERETIRREMEFTDQDMTEYVYDYLHGSAYADQPLGYNILGTEESLANMNHNVLKAFLQKHYTADRMAIVATGAVDHDELVKAVEAEFGGMAAGPGNIAMAKAKWIGSDVREINEDMPLAYTGSAMEGPGAAHADTIPLYVLQSILGSFDAAAPHSDHLASKLVSSVRDLNMGVKSLQTFFIPYSDTSLFGVQYVAEPEHLSNIQLTVQEELVRSCSQITENDVTRGVSAFKAAFAAQTATTNGLADVLGQNVMLLGRTVPFGEIEARLAEVTPATVQDAANRYLYDREIVSAAVGPVQTFPEYNRLRGWTYSLLS